MMAFRTKKKEEGDPSSYAVLADTQTPFQIRQRVIGVGIGFDQLIELLITLLGLLLERLPISFNFLVYGKVSHGLACLLSSCGHNHYVSCRTN